MAHRRQHGILLDGSRTGGLQGSGRKPFLESCTAPPSGGGGAAAAPSFKAAIPFTAEMLCSVTLGLFQSRASGRLWDCPSEGSRERAGVAPNRSRPASRGLELEPQVSLVR